VGKPFHTPELIARLQAVLRRRHGHAEPQLSVAGWTLDEDRQEATAEGKEPVSLTGIEFRLLRYFMLHPDRILSKSRLTEHVYEGDAEPDSNVVEVYVKRLRRKLGDGVIETHRGQGYRFPGTSGPRGK
jgi:DNA-binding response OmpR family regulator